MSSKKELRLRFRTHRMSMTPEHVQSRSQLICTSLFNRIRKDDYQTIAIFLPIRTFNEPDISPLLKQLQAGNIRMLLPIVDGLSLITVHYEEGMALKKSYGGTSIPETITLIDPSEAELVLVPMLAADKQGYRLGYGKGFYDRFLEDLKSEKWGICFDEEAIDELPFDVHDQKIDAIVTDKRFIWL